MELQQYIKPFLRWWWLILLSIGIAATGSYMVASQQPLIYQTSTTLMIGQVLQKTDVTGQDFTITQQLAESYAQIAVRQPVLQASVESLGLQMSWQQLKGRVYVQSIPQTQLLVVSVTDVVPDRAVAIADEIANQLILQSPRSPQNEVRQERTEFISSQLDALEGRIARAQGRVVELEAELDTALSARKIQDLQNEIAGLDSLIKGWQTNYTGLLDFLQGGDGPNFLTVIEPAQSARVVGSKLWTNVLLAATVGFVLATVAVFLLEYIDDTVKSSEELGESLGVPSLGAIDMISGEDYRQKMIAAGTLFSPGAEAYRILRANIQFMTVDKPFGSLLITSPASGEGKSTTAANLGIVMAEAELRTIIIDADLRRPTIHKMFDLPNLSGLTDLIFSTEGDIDSQLQTTHVKNLKIITSGVLPANPSEMLGSKRLVRLLEHLNEVADIIILDSPPVLNLSDSAILSNKVDGVVVVTQSGYTRRNAAKQAIQSLQQVGANVIGVVLNKVPARKGTYYNYAYSYRGNAAPKQEVRWPLSWWRRLPFLRN